MRYHFRLFMLHFFPKSRRSHTHMTDDKALYVKGDLNIRLWTMSALSQNISWIFILKPSPYRIEHGLNRCLSGFCARRMLLRLLHPLLARVFCRSKSDFFWDSVAYRNFVILFLSGVNIGGPVYPLSGMLTNFLNTFLLGVKNWRPCFSHMVTICMYIVQYWACIPRPIRLEAFLKAWSFRVHSKSVLSLVIKVW